MTDLRDNGWVRELEDSSTLKALTKSKVPKAFKTFAAPVEVRPDLGANAHKLENQSSMGSCQGHAIASCCEQLHTIATGGDRTQLSNIFAYLASQRITGDQLFGRDSGSTISSGVELATGNGICPEALAPYPNPVRYPNSSERNRILSDENYAAGKPYMIRSSVGIKTYDDAVTWIGGGGAINLGIAWPPKMRNVSGRKTAVAAASSGGGHAIAGLGYKKNGNLIFANSHNYWMDITPDAFEQMLKHRWTVAIGLSDMANPVPRTLADFKKGMSEWAKEVRDIWS